jgi:serine/threonine protein kinase
MPLGLRAPEAILGGPISEKVDIWAFGCLIYEFLTARQLFPVYWYETGAQLDDAHLLHITLQICPLPDKLFEKWSRRHRYFGPNRELISTEVDADDKNVDDGKISTPRIKLPVSSMRNGLKVDQDKWATRRRRRSWLYYAGLCSLIRKSDRPRQSSWIMDGSNRLTGKRTRTLYSYLGQQDQHHKLCGRKSVGMNQQINEQNLRAGPVVASSSDKLLYGPPPP